MPAPVPVPVRAALFRRWYQGQSVADLAAHFALSPRTVRSLVRRFRSCGDRVSCPRIRIGRPLPQASGNGCATKRAPCGNSTPVGGPA